MDILTQPFALIFFQIVKKYHKSTFAPLMYAELEGGEIDQVVFFPQPLPEPR
jgi:hypothetical protein